MKSKSPKLKVGDRFHVWWRTDTPDNMAIILAILPYNGLFKQYFNCVLKLTAPNTEKGYLEMVWKQ